MSIFDLDQTETTGSNGFPRESRYTEPINSGYLPDNSYDLAALQNVERVIKPPPRRTKGIEVPRNSKINTMVAHKYRSRSRHSAHSGLMNIEENTANSRYMHRSSQVTDMLGNETLTGRTVWNRKTIIPSNPFKENNWGRRR